MGLSWRWIGLGVLALYGALAFGLDMLAALHHDEQWLHVALAIVAPGATAALLMTFAPLRPWREPVIATLVVVFASNGILVASGHATIDQLASVSAAGRWAAIVASAFMGGWLIRRWGPRLNSGPFSIVMLSGLIMYGVIGLSRPFQAHASAWGGFAAIVAGSFLVQLVLSSPQRWLCGSGVVVVGAKLIAADLDSGAALDKMMLALLQDVVSLFGAVAIGAGGAHVAYKLKTRCNPGERLDVPAAHIE